MPSRAIAVLMGVAAVALPAAQVVVATWGNRADRQSTSAKDNRFSKKAARWEAVFDGLVMADMYLFVKQSVWLGVLMLMSSYWAKYWALERRRKKFRARTKQPKRKKPNPLATVLTDNPTVVVEE